MYEFKKERINSINFVRSGSPADEQHVAAPHGIEPDLVAKDR
ncbi:hypothetical protein WUBG_19149 [Wuchereria bancrofti]|uniref:Uncharacterized protein n=1 Tax=Wuchereria bancrofti TaxID=6293 RepID=J9E3H2_WUCBA|nr:hypothetical protein WUBG_19149 [Wuchereria bancrofti]